MKWVKCRKLRQIPPSPSVYRRLGWALPWWLLALSDSTNAGAQVGMIAASGVVVNDSLVLLDYIREREAAGGLRPPVSSLILEACTNRFRSILLAFLTNFAGFLPTLLETSVQAQFLIPMTLSLSAGLLVGIVASLLLTPVCYAMLEDFRLALPRRYAP